MKNLFTTALLAAFTLQFTTAQIVTDTVSTGASYVNQIWYSLPADEVATQPKDNWDIAFEASGYAASILANTQKGLAVYATPYTVANWANVDTAGIDGWTQLHNSDVSWDEGAFNAHPDGNLDLGWGTYNMNTHEVSGDSVYVIQLLSGAWKKFRVDALTNGTYTFTWADLDGNNQQSGSVAKADYTGKNFGYFSLENNTALDREPARADWDFTFTKYMTTLYVPNPTPYGVTGLLLNKNVTAVKAYPVDVNTVTHTSYTFQSNINTIGYNWKSFTGGVYVIADSTVYFVERANGDIWKVILTGFGGGANGNYIFSKELVYTATTGLSPQPNSVNTLGVYPNPAVGNVNLVCQLQGNNAVNTEVKIYDLSGRTVLQQNILLQPGLTQQAVSVANLQPGVYVVAIGGNTQRLVVQ